MDTTKEQDAQRLRELRDEADDLETQAKDAKEAYEKAHRALFERMQAEDSQGFKTGGFNFIPVTTNYPRIEDKDAFLEWAKENSPDNVQETVRKEHLSELIREHLDDGKPLPPGLSFYPKEYVAQRKVPQKKN